MCIPYIYSENKRIRNLLGIILFSNFYLNFLFFHKQYAFFSSDLKIYSFIIKQLTNFMSDFHENFFSKRMTFVTFFKFSFKFPYICLPILCMSILLTCLRIYWNFAQQVCLFFPFEIFTVFYVLLGFIFLAKSNP